MKKRSSIIFTSVLSVILIIYLVFWIVVNYVFIPKVIVPKMKEYIDTNINDPISLIIDNVSYHPFKGFILQNVVLSGPVKLKDNYILHAKSVDIDLAFLPLFLKRIEIKRFNMFKVDLNIGRDKKGIWNFKPLLELDIMKGDSGDFTFIIKKFKLKKCWIDYTDYFKRDNVLERRFTNVDLDIINPKTKLYKVMLSGGTKDRNEESIYLKLDYNSKRKSVEGKFRLNTRFLGEYWDYYLDDMLKPWHLKSANVVVNMGFSYIKDTLSLKGEYTIDNGVLSFGDFSIKGNALVKQNVKLVKDVPDKDIGRIDLYLTDISSLTGKHIFLDKGRCRAIVTAKEIIFKELTGIMRKRIVNYNGKFTFSDPKELYLTGEIANVNNTFRLKLLSENTASLDWHGNAGDSYINHHVDIHDLKDLAFDLKIEGDVQLSDFSELLEIDKDNVKGAIGLFGNIGGEIDEVSSFHGKLKIDVKDFSVLSLRPEAFAFNFDIKNGIFVGDIPATDFYGGNMHGTVELDYFRWGVELHVDKFDIEKFVQTSPKLKGMKGIFTGNIAAVSEWTNFNAVSGGGYFKITDCDLWNAPVFSNTEEGVESVTTDVDMPEISNIDGNYEIEKDGIGIENVSCKAKGMNLKIKGKYYFSKEADFTVGVRILGEGLFRTVRQILLPVTIGFDVVANCIQVKVNGRWPDLEEKTELQPIGILTAIFPSGRASPKKYTLSKLWSGKESNDKAIGSNLEKRKNFGSR